MNKNINQFKVLIVDAYGVFNFGNGISKSVIATFQKWMAEGKQVYILSNTTAVNAGAIKSYEKKGVIRGVHYTDMMTSGQFASEDIQAGNLPVNGKKYYVFGTANFKKPDEKIPAIFAGSPYELASDLHDADFIYCGIPQLLDDELFPYDSTEIDDFVVQVKALVESGKPMVCANPDRTANEGGRFVIRQGSIAKLFEEFGGKVIYYGKPDPKVFYALLDRYCPNVRKDEVLMIGDTLRTDIKGAQRAGIRGALVLEGGITEYEMNLLGVSLTEYIGNEKVVPNYVWDRVSEEPLF
ncbi:MAG: TIGR01459 family HAD-type hydrolase [Alphaproteobacteria bacterium]|nr:TIGR01459 family HAD-type hydrolase [Alphaproteobacteria bacterium]